MIKQVCERGKNKRRPGMKGRTKGQNKERRSKTKETEKKTEGDEKSELKLLFFFLVELRKVRLYRERKRREAAAPRGTYSSPPFCPCAPFCTAP